jgi:hypothetical protein
MDKEVINSEKRYCTKCNSEIKTNRKKFCSVKCAKAFHSLKRYHKIKSTPKYKEQRTNYLKTHKGGVTN